MALYMSPARRRRTTVIVASMTLVVGLAVGVVIGRASSSGIDEAVTESRAAARSFTSSLQVLPLEYDKVAGDANAARDLIGRALSDEDQLFDLAPWLPESTVAMVRADLDVVRSAPSTALEPDDFNAAVDAAVTDVESAFGLTRSG